MEKSKAVKTVAQPKGLIGAHSARRRFVPAQREPLMLPDEKVELPSPSPAPPPLNPPNLLTSILPPALMLVGTLIGALINTSSLWAMIPMFLMSLGFPAASLISYASLKKSTQNAMEQRESTYRLRLKDSQKHLDGLCADHRNGLEEIYPNLQDLSRITQTRGKLLWSRRPMDDDFLSLRIGIGDGKPCFSVEAPRFGDPTDKLAALASDVVHEYQNIPQLPILLPLLEVGSVAITGRSTASVYSFTRKLVLDILVHHSPQDVQIAVLGDTRNAVTQWEWLKWVPHTDSLRMERPFFHLAFDAINADHFLEFLVKEFHDRRDRSAGSLDTRKRSQAAYVILMEDSEAIRLHADIPLLAELGHEAGIFLLFVGGKNWPRECRSRIDIGEDRRFKFTPTWTKAGSILTGDYETATPADCEKAARSLAELDMASSGSRIPLPETIRLTQILGTASQSVEAVKQAWSEEILPKDQLHFPIGVCAKRDHLELTTINLLPGELGGSNAYHTILIGTTGSGKSEFMKSLVMGAAVSYPPNLLNFFFMDFKGGAAFGIFENLPHASGVVTNLGPELVNRGLDSIKNEIDRRQKEFGRCKVQWIWEYNSLGNVTPMPHLVLFLDEFARGLLDFPRLRETLDVLVRQGRSLGMYLILANQDANAEVDKLLNNVGWRIALKVGKPEAELSIIDRRLPNLTRAGQGYLRSANGDITEFQAGYGKIPVQSMSSADSEGFVIYSVDPDGGYSPFYKQSMGASPHKGKSVRLAKFEEEFILSILQQATTDLHIQPAQRIYLDPLPETIPLDEILSEAGVAPVFADGKWQKEKDAIRIVGYWGRQDIPRECMQQILEVDFDDRDGNLWIIGGQGSGKGDALTSLLLSLSMTYTPEQVQFYLLDFGSGELASLEGLPHTGSVIRPLNQEKERFTRLLNFLDGEMDRRTTVGNTAEKHSHSIEPAIFVVINNYADLYTNFQDESNRLMRFFRDGKPAGIHVIILTNRGPDLISKVSSNISRRLVLQLGSRDDYPDLIGRQTPPPNADISGRGYWVDGTPCECQVADPPPQWRDQIRKMRSAWTGALPKPIEILPACIALSEMQKNIHASRKAGQILIPVGRLYESLEPVLPNLTDSIPFWLILGPKESGKSNFLACVGKSIVEMDPKGWHVKAYAFRRSPLVTLGQNESRINVLTQSDEIQKDCQAMIDTLTAGQPVVKGKKLLLLVDDFGFAFLPGKDVLLNALNSLAQALEGTTDFFIMGSGLLDELRMQIPSSFNKLLRQGRTGLVLSKDPNELDWLGTQLPPEYRRMDLPLGRGFFINKGRQQLLQTPFFGECEKK